MEILRASIDKALAGAAEANAFKTIQNQPHARSLIGLLIAQGRSFSHAQRARKSVFRYLEENKVDLASDEAVWKALGSLDENQWKEWKISSHVGQALTRLQESLKTRSLKEILAVSVQSTEYRIGPWTRKAFLIMTASDDPREAKEPNVLLTEDSWVRQRWSELVRLLKLKLADYPLTLETCRQLDIHPINLSRVLWRLTKEGVRRLVHPDSKIKQATEWFIQ